LTLIPVDKDVRFFTSDYLAVKTYLNNPKNFCKLNISERVKQSRKVWSSKNSNNSMKLQNSRAFVGVSDHSKINKERREPSELGEGRGGCQVAYFIELVINEIKLFSTLRVIFVYHSLNFTNMEISRILGSYIDRFRYDGLSI